LDENRIDYSEWLELLEQCKYAKLKQEMNEDNEANIAEFFEEVPEDKRLLVFRLLTKDNAADVFSYMDSDLQEQILISVTDNEAQTIINELSIDDAVDFLSELPANVITRLLKYVSEDRRKTINRFLNYPDDSAGSIMTIEFMALKENYTVGKSMEIIRKNGFDKETIYSCYVLDERRKLLGVVSLRRLIISDDDLLVTDIMEDNVIYVHTLDDQEMIADIFKKYNLIALPVVDNEKRLVGIITVDDIVDVIEEENTEDIEKMSALIPSEDEYLKTGVFSLAKNRIFWLMVLMIAGTISSAIISGYDEVLSSSIILASFIPILMNTGGNAGSQASALIIRGMAVGEIEMNDVLRVIWKEIRVGIICGIALAAVNFLRLRIMNNPPLAVNLAVSISIGITVAVSKVVGCVLPMVAKKLKFDPAIMSGPLITTIVDSVSLIVFFNMAQLLVF